MEAVLTGAPIDDRNTEMLVVDAEENSDRDITEGSNSIKISKASDEMEIDLKEKQKTEAYQDTLNIDIENTNKAKNTHKHHKTTCSKTYEVM